MAVGTRWLWRAARLDVALVATIICHVVVRVLYADFVPIFDSRQYFEDCLLPYREAPLDLLRLDCFGHPSLAFMVLIALSQAVAFGSTYALHAATTVLGVASIVAFHRLCSRLLPADAHTWERRALVACFGLGPTCLAGGVNFNPDYGAMAFFVLMLERLLAGRFVMTAVFGSCLLLCKESGALLYAVSVGVVVLHDWIRPHQHPPPAPLARASGWLSVPVVVLGLVKLAELSRGMPVVWRGERNDVAMLPMFFTFEFLDPTFLTYAFDNFGLGFKWLLGLPVLIFSAVLGVRSLVGRPVSTAEGVDPRYAKVLLVSFALCFLLLTRFKTVNNVRYFDALSPLFIATAGYALCWLELRAWFRHSLLALALVLTFSFNFHSFDPVSRAFFGTFAFGDHELLRTAVRDICCGHGRDQLEYNFQFTELHYLQNAIYRDLRPDTDTELVATKFADVYLAGRIDTRSFERTLRLSNSRSLRIQGVRELLHRRPLPQWVHFIVFPNFDNERAYAMLAEHYDEASRRTYRHGGYALLVHTLLRKH